VTLRVSVNTCPATSDQRGLLPERTRRDAAAANRALARLRAELGENSVMHAVIRDAHLPSARFAWEPLTHVPERASPRVVSMRPLVRRILATPVLASTEWQRARSNLTGPYVIAGGWWSGGVRREYFFARTSDGALLWVYFDHRRQQFFLQGTVE
jgi:protein ImuB